MKKQFEQGELATSEAQHINSLIMEKASETAELITQLECKARGIDCYVLQEGTGVATEFTDQAQDIFNHYYDNEMADLYNIFNDLLKAVEVTTEQARETLSEAGHFVGNLWHFDDLDALCKMHNLPELSKEEKKEFFNFVEKYFNAEIGVNWESLFVQLEEFLESEKSKIIS